jgi:choline dehydrogenase-like flavoprotein
LSPLAAAKACLNYVTRRKGPFAESFVAIGGFIRSEPAVEFADTIVVLGPSLLQRASGKGSWRDLLPKEQGFFIGVSLGRPHSVGQIRLRSSDPADPPRIFPNYFSDERDLTALAIAVQSLRRVAKNECILRYIDAERDRDTFDEDLDAIKRSIRATAGSLSHPTGSCRMGADSRAVVDSQLRVNGVEGLRVADNSIIPTALNAAPHAAALMIGEKAVALITGRLTANPLKR